MYFFDLGRTLLLGVSSSTEVTIDFDDLNPGINFVASKKPLLIVSS